MYAAYDKEVVKLLLSCGANVDTEDVGGKTAFDYARYEAKILMDIITIPNANNKSSLKAVIANNMDKVKSLIENGADINTKTLYGNYTPLLLAARMNNSKMSKLLIDAGCEVNVNNFKNDTALRIATAHDNIVLVKMLIDAKACVNVKDWDGGTAFMVAANHGNIEIAKMLVDAGADVHAEDNHGNTARSYMNWNPQVKRKVKAELKKLLKRKEAKR